MKKNVYKNCAIHINSAHTFSNKKNILTFFVKCGKINIENDLGIVGIYCGI